MSKVYVHVLKKTPDRPELKQVSKLCGISNAKAFFAWFELSCIFLEHVKDDNILLCTTLKECSEETHCPGIAEAFAKIGWLKVVKIGDYESIDITQWRIENEQKAKSKRRGI